VGVWDGVVPYVKRERLLGHGDLPSVVKKNAAASASAKLRWAHASDEEIRASVSKTLEISSATYRFSVSD
jgi:hypothetical protein